MCAGSGVRKIGVLILALLYDLTLVSWPLPASVFSPVKRYQSNLNFRRAQPRLSEAFVKIWEEVCGNKNGQHLWK